MAGLGLGLWIQKRQTLDRNLSLGHWGKRMLERPQSLGGALNVNSALGQGRKIEKLNS